MIAEAERERRSGAVPEPARDWAGRLRATVMRWVAHAVAEQRLLWHLREPGRRPACTFLTICSEARRHPRAAGSARSRPQEAPAAGSRFDSVLLVRHRRRSSSGCRARTSSATTSCSASSGTTCPLRGASQGLNVTVWTHRAGAPLTELRRLLTIEPGAARAARARRPADAAARAPRQLLRAKRGVDVKLRDMAARLVLRARGRRRHRHHPRRGDRGCRCRRPDVLREPQICWTSCARRARPR